MPVREYQIVDIKFSYGHGQDYDGSDIGGTLYNIVSPKCTIRLQSLIDEKDTRTVVLDSEFSSQWYSQKVPRARKIRQRTFARSSWRKASRGRVLKVECTPEMLERDEWYPTDLKEFEIYKPQEMDSTQS